MIYEWAKAIVAVTVTGTVMINSRVQAGVAVVGDGGVEISVNGGNGVRFDPDFTVLFVETPLILRSFRLTDPLYSVPAWQIRGHREPLRSPFEAAETIRVRAIGTEKRDGVIHWSFPDDPRFALEAEVHQTEGRAEPRVFFRLTAKTAGQFSVAYSGAPERKPTEVDGVFQPLIWHGKRFPEEAYLSPEYNCSIPGALATADGVTYGVVADPASLPFRMPMFKNNLFGVMIRNADGNAQPQVFAPVLGGTGSAMEPGNHIEFNVLLLARAGGWLDTFEYVARDIMGFHDYRRNTRTSLNQTLDNMIEFGMSEQSRFIEEERGFSYATDMPGAVKNVSALHPMSVALVADDEEIFRHRVVPLLEYLLSREKFLFSRTGDVGSQTATSNMQGPAMPVSELAEFQSLMKGANPVFLEYAKRLYGKDRVLNMTTVTHGGTWKRDLSLYRATGDRRYLIDAIRKADDYIEQRIKNPPSDFLEAATATFWDNILPAWPQLFELYEDSGEKRFLEAAVRGAREHATIMWFYPRIPDESITVNKGGVAPLYRAGEPIRISEESVPAWQVSEMGLIAEGIGTAGGGHRGIFLTTYAPYFLRLARHANDPFLRDIARSAMVGRYSNFPGYHMNMEYSTVYEYPDFPLRPHEEHTSTSMHYNHIWVQIPMLLDYLVADAFDRSKGAIDFPSRFVEGYAYLYGKAYGDRPGRFYGDENVWLWMPRGVLQTDQVQANYLTAAGNGNFYAALKNQSDEAMEVTVRIHPDVIPDAASKTYAVRVWKDNEPSTSAELKNGEIRLPLSPKGITAMAVDGLAVTPRFRDRMLSAPSAPWSVPFASSDTPIGTLQGWYVGTLTGMVLSFGDRSWVYGYLEGDFADLSLLDEVTFHYRAGDQWREYVSKEYPWEFSVPLQGDESEVEIYMVTRTPASEQEMSERILLRKQTE